MRALYMSLFIVALISGVALGQSVWFDVVPVASTTVEVNPGPVAVVQPGEVVSFEIVAEVVNVPFAPSHAGLAGFNASVWTNLGVVQPFGVEFDAGILPLFTVGRSTGTAGGDDILGISGQQPTNGGLIATGVALNQPAIIATGQLATPTFEGAFEVGITGEATVFGIAVGPILTRQAGIMSFGNGFTIQTQIPRPKTTEEPVIPSDSGIPDETADSRDSDDEQVASAIPAAPTAVCGLGTELAAAMAVVFLSVRRKTVLGS